jgi:hypothetical protein
LVIIFAFMLIGVVTWVALITADKTMNAGITKASIASLQSAQAHGDRDAAREVTPARAFTLGKHKMLAGWKVQKDTSLGDAKFTVTGKVKNLRGHTSTASIHFTFIDKSGEVLASVQCNSADLKSGHTQALNCIPDGKYGKYKTVTAEAAS